MPNFRPVGALEVSNSYNGVGKKVEKKRKKVHWVISRVASQLKIVFTPVFSLFFPKILMPIVTETRLGSPRLVIEIRSGRPRLVIEIRTGRL